jgi:hypothetical protein
MGTVVVVVPPTEPGVFLQLWVRGNPKDPPPRLRKVIQRQLANRPSYTNVLTPTEGGFRQCNRLIVGSGRAIIHEREKTFMRLTAIYPIGLMV